MTEHYHPLNSLKGGHWFKLICGASFQHLPAVRNLTLAYTLAGADCIDVAADPAAIAAAQEALQVASEIQAQTQNPRFGGKGLPWLMVSLNDGEDPHFRKAEFNPVECPADCWRPCEKICPAEAIIFQGAGEGVSGVIDERCYGCGRCLPVCPSQLIYTRSYVSAPAAIAPLILPYGVDALEIHTQVGRETDFARLWSSINPWVHQLKLIAISCPDGDGLIDYLRTLYQIISPLPCPLIWQTDGRPMSGDIGIGATRAAVKLGQKVLAAGLPGYVQLAGGTNAYTVSKLRASGLMKEHGKNLSIPDTPHIAGIAYGSYARFLLSPILEQLETMQIDRALAIPNAIAPPAAGAHIPGLTQLEAFPELLWQAVSLAHSLVSPLKEY
ncbi:MAG: LdpA C-terminal domain-containing domain [Tychonema bourrellyi B0820]|uniref:4Fe-4S ferredoxin n=1 Tax=Tychonema bourrellyi FEM_GT703 TaxID=2040638 RepID=A0A2G4F614_9CYAN|nr:LdpA C-terminal domain-containing domain [Tychonema bourrellyi]MDQ2098305.1 LdpA C-terminal domain-containing domain [Tychonema bourrellyi B0820]PHX56927.1 4Fe-4S ferredoxin [Tychonema bourrellyi FEM_GT703]